MILKAAVFILMVTSHQAFALVDMKNANYSQTWVDIEVPGSGYDLQVVRTYNSRSLFDGMFGFGWCSNFETNLEIANPTTLKIVECGSGQQTAFNATKGKAGAEGATFVSANNRADIITFTKNQYSRQLPDGSSMRFASSGDLVLIYDRNANYIRMERAQGLLRGVVDNNGRRLTFNYFPNKKVRNITGPNSLSANYVYAGLVDLASVRNGWGKTYKYEYDDLHNLTRAVYPDGTDIVLTYDQERDWVTSFKDRDKCSEKYTYELSKSDPKNHYWANVVKTCGERIVNTGKHEFWFKNRKSGEPYLSRVLSINNSNSVDITYHVDFGRPASIRRNGILYTYEYNSKGLVEKKTEPGMIMTYVYHPQTSRLTKYEIQFLDDNNKVRERRVTEFKYDNKLNLRRATDSDGRVVEMAYDERGRVVQVMDQTKKLTKLTYEERFGRPRIIERPGLGRVEISYKPNGEIDKVQSQEGPVVTMQVAATFNAMLEMIAPVTAEIYN